MRTTLTLDNDVLSLARSLAQARKISVGEAVSMLARRGATAKPATSVRNGFVTFHTPPSTPRFGPEDVAAAIAGESSELSFFFLPSEE